MKNYILFLLVGLFIGCTEIPPEIPKTSISGEKVILIEDFTGVKCTNCPTAAAEISTIEANFPGKVISVAIHAPKFFTFTTPSAKSKYDFRIPEADAIIENLDDPEGLPSSAFDRLNLDLGDSEGNIVGQVSNYVKAFEKAIERPAQALISIENEYDEISRTLSTTVNARALNEIKGDIYLTVYVIESGLIDFQVGKTQEFLDYEHNHVLRDVITQPLGILMANGMSDAEIISKSFSYKIPEDIDELNQYIPENMDIIAFIHHNTIDNKEVLQTAIEPILE